MSAAFDPGPAHRFFSSHCFNSTWDLIDKVDRTPDEGREMLARAMASLWHWRQRADVGPRQLSVGCWQVSRVLCLIGQSGLALDFARESLEHAATKNRFNGRTRWKRWRGRSSWLAVRKRRRKRSGRP